MITRHRIVIGGMFEPIAYELQQAGLVTIERVSTAHVFFTVRDDALGLARPTDDGWAVEFLLADRTGGVVATLLATQLRAHFEDYNVSDPVEVPVPATATPHATGQP